MSAMAVRNCKDRDQARRLTGLYLEYSFCSLSNMFLSIVIEPFSSRDSVLGHPHNSNTPTAKKMDSWNQNNAIKRRTVVSCQYNRQRQGTSESYLSNTPPLGL